MMRSLLMSLLILQLSPAGLSQACAWDPMSLGAAAGPVLDLTVFDDGTGPALYVIGLFSLPGGMPSTGFSKWDGTSWSSLPQGGGERTLEVFDDGTGAALYSAGVFGIIEKWDGTAWSSVGPSTGWAGHFGIPSFATIQDLEVFDDGTGPALYAVGDLTMAAGVPVNNIARWDGSAWGPVGGGFTLFASSLPCNGVLTTFDDGTGPALYAGGWGLQGALIMKWDGTSWSTVGNGLTGPLVPLVCSLAVFDDGSGPALYAGGHFQSSGNVPVNNIARWDGVSWQPVGGGLVGTVPPWGDPFVNTLLVHDDGSGPALYAGRGFDFFGGVLADALSRWDGVNWTPVANVSIFVPSPQTSFPSIIDLEIFDSGSGPQLYVAGAFADINGTPASGIARSTCTPPVSISFSQPGGPGGPVYLSNMNLTTGQEYFTLLSLDPCPGALGTGPIGGLCLNTAINFQFMAAQLAAPLGTSPIHFQAQSSFLLSGPFNLPPLTLEAICFRWTGSALGSVSPTISLTIQ